MLTCRSISPAIVGKFTYPLLMNPRHKFAILFVKSIICQSSQRNWKTWKIKMVNFTIGAVDMGTIIFRLFVFCFCFCFSTGLVRLYIAGLPLRSCRTIGAPSVQGSAHCAFFPFLVAAGFGPTSLSLGGGRLNRYPILTPCRTWRCASVYNFF